MRENAVPFTIQRVRTKISSQRQEVPRPIRFRKGVHAKVGKCKSDNVDQHKDKRSGKSIKIIHGEGSIDWKDKVNFYRHEVTKTQMYKSSGSLRCMSKLRVSNRIFPPCPPWFAMSLCCDRREKNCCQGIHLNLTR